MNGENRITIKVERKERENLLSKVKERRRVISFREEDFELEDIKNTLILNQEYYSSTKSEKVESLIVKNKSNGAVLLVSELENVLECFGPYNKRKLLATFL